MELKDIRHQLVLAAQNHYDELMEDGMSPYAIASYHFEEVISKKLSEFVDTSAWKAGNYKELQYSMDATIYPSESGKEPGEGLWAVGAILSSKEAWATPGFAEAYINSCNS